MLKYYPQFGLHFVWEELPMDEGYAYLTVAIMGDGWLQFNGVKMSGKGYIGQEAQRLIEIAKKQWQESESN